MAKEAIEKIIDLTAKRKDIYAFTASRVEEVEEEVTKETKDGEEVTLTQTKQKKVPYRVVIRKPTRRQIEEAEMEYSIEISNCVKKGILTKAMLSKKYSDSGGLMSEEDALALQKLYSLHQRLILDFEEVDIKKRKTSKEKTKLKEIQEGINRSKREIIDLEMGYSSLFNHTADTKAQNRVITWYMLNLTYVHKESDEESGAIPLFDGETFEEKRESYYAMEEDDDNEFYEAVRGKLTTIVSFWFFSENAEEKDFQKLEMDIDKGEV
jgi:hypothetical protein